MSETATTSFSNKCIILTDLWISWQTSQCFADLFAFGKLGFPLAYAISNNVVAPTEEAKDSIDKVWDAFLDLLDIEDGDFFSQVEQMFYYAHFYPDEPE